MGHTADVHEEGAQSAGGVKMEWSVGAGLEGKVVVVTGAAGGIGQAVARSFAVAGAHVLATDVRQEPLDELMSALPGTQHVGLALDLNDESSRNELIDVATKRMGGLYAFAHTAALLIRRQSLDEVTEADWDSQMNTNLKATFFLSREVGRVMTSQGAGRIILFTSQSWWTGGFGGSSVYAASKGGIVSLARSLARNFGPHGVTVNTVAPGQINTPMLLTDLDPAVYEKMRKETPLGYVGEPDDVAGVVVFLASDHARYISGATINVSGGYLMY
jgi:NAD(P)-dependent dehydrogenase (short-subunit alcohol dehydrogenase family)